MEDIGQESTSEILSADTIRKKATRDGAIEMDSAAAGDSSCHAAGQQVGLIGTTLPILQVSVQETAARAGSAGRATQPFEDG